MTDRELMQEALYALTYVGDAKEIYSDTIESLRARLAQPEPEALGEVIPADEEQLKRIAKLIEPEPVWVEVTTNTGDKFILDSAVEADKIRAARDAGLLVIPLYTAPPQRDEAPAKAVEWQGLTDEEVEGLWDSSFYDYVGITALRAIVRAIEAKLKEKNHDKP